MLLLLDALRAAAEPTRLRLLAICAWGELTVSELTNILGQSQPRVSRHLKLLCDAGLLERFREQNYVFYRLASKGVGAELAARVLELLPEDNETVKLDRQRVAAVCNQRGREASALLSSLDGEFAWLTPLTHEESQVGRMILEQFGDSHLGELLDIGTGTGRMLKLLGDLADRALGIDISPDMLRVARARLGESGMTNVSVRKGDMYHLNFPDATFDTVTIDLVLSQAEAPASVIAEAARVLKPGGRLLAVDFADGRSKKVREKIQGLSVKTVEAWLETGRLKLQHHKTIRGQEHKQLLIFAEKPLSNQEAA